MMKLFGLFYHITGHVKDVLNLMSADHFSASGAETGWTDLTALAVVSIQLFDKDGSAIQVSDPIHISVPLPSDTRNRMATSVPAWLYQPKTGKRNMEIIFAMTVPGSRTETYKTSRLIEVDCFLVFFYD